MFLAGRTNTDSGRVMIEFGIAQVDGDFSLHSSVALSCGHLGNLAAAPADKRVAALAGEVQNGVADRVWQTYLSDRFKSFAQRQRPIRRGGITRSPDTVRIRHCLQAGRNSTCRKKREDFF